MKRALWVLFGVVLIVMLGCDPFMFTSPHLSRQQSPRRMAVLNPHTMIGRQNSSSFTASRSFAGERKKCAASVNTASQVNKG